MSSREPIVRAWRTNPSGGHTDDEEGFMNETANNSSIDVETSVDPEQGGGSSRRAMLRNLAFGVAAAGTVTVIGNASSADAADGDNVVLGQTKEHTTTTNVNYKGPTVASSFNIQSGDQTAANDGILNSNFASGGTTLLGVAISRVRR